MLKSNDKLYRVLVSMDPEGDYNGALYFRYLIMDLLYYYEFYGFIYRQLYRVFDDLVYVKII